MAEVPREAVEFARMVVRAFYPIEFAVIADGVLRRNNYCSHKDLARVLKIQPKELRQILTRMVTARLMCSEKRQQKRVNFKDEKRPTRLVHTEFWYVPLVELVDAFQYRVDIISKQLEERIRKESELDRYKCQRCGTRYKLVDICANVDPETGMFICDAIGYSRVQCNGEIREEDNSSVLKETESFKKRFEDELRPLRALADVCSNMKIPSHPLEGADEATWAMYVPEIVGLHGEVVDEEGLTKEIAAEVNGTVAPIVSETEAMTSVPEMASAADNGAIPEKPDWFKESKKGGDDLDEGWEDDNDGFETVQNQQPAFGTGTMFGTMDDAKSYLDAYVQSISGVGPQADETLTVKGDVFGGDDQGSSASPTHPEVTAATPARDTGLVQEDNVTSMVADDAMVSVGGERIALRDVTDEHINKMSEDEYQSKQLIRVWCPAILLTFSLTVFSQVTVNQA